MVYSEEYNVDLTQVPLRSHQESSGGMYISRLEATHQTDWGLETPDFCVICFETLDATASYRRLPCEHLLHQPCIDHWLCSRDTSCPLCRQGFYHLRQRRKQSSSSIDPMTTILYIPPPPRRNASNGRLNSLKSWCKQKLRRHDQSSTDTVAGQ